MTSETPCLSGCREWPTYPSNGIGWANSDGVSVTHAPNCPNAKPAEPMRGPYSHADPLGETIMKPTEPPASQESTVVVEYRLLDGKVVTSKPQSEPPIADGVGVGIANLFMGHEAETAGKVLARAYLSLKAERDALRAENAAKYEEIASERHSYILLEAERQRLYDGNAALKARMEELSESLLWATSSYEERVVILANREKRKEQEASNGK